MATSTRGLRRLAVFTTAIVVAAVTGCTSPDDSDTPEANGATPGSGACAVPSAPPGGTDGKADAAPGGGGLRVTEKGFTQQGDANSRMSLGAVVENTGTQVAYRTRVTFGYTDAQGKSAAPPDARELTLEIPVILPGQRVPVGTGSYVIQTANGVQRATAVDMQVTLGAVKWVSKDATFAQLTAKPQTVTRNDTDPVSGTVTYTVDSQYCRALSPRGVGMVFRDSGGAIVGGGLDLGSDQQKCAPGSAVERALATGSLPANIDNGKTEVYPYCDLAPAVQPAPAGAPFN